MEINFKIKIGCDILKLDRFENIIKKNNRILLNNLFSEYELTNAHSIKSLAGLFSAKESVIKALPIKPGNWRQIEIYKQESGKPIVKLHEFDISLIISHDLSISHDGDYIFTTCCFLLK